MAGFFYFIPARFPPLSIPLLISNIAVDANCNFICLKNLFVLFYSDGKNPIFTGQTQFLC
jgi:hypothetical protein